MIDGFRHLGGYYDLKAQCELVACVQEIIAVAPLYTPVMPRTGRPFSVQMTNCGVLGWVCDKDRGYRYQAVHPVSGKAWPSMPAPLVSLWQQVADWPSLPEACLINYYPEGAKLGSHVDADEAEREAPVVSVSLGDEAVFHVGGVSRSAAKERVRLLSGDVVVLGGASRRAYHGIDRIKAGTSDLLAEGGRFNLTLRRVTVA